MKRIVMIAIVLALAVLLGGDASALSFGKTKYFLKKADGSWVKTCPGNKKQGPFEHPHEFSAADMAKALGSMQYFRPGFFSVTGAKGKEYNMFTQEEIELLAEPLAEAFKAVESNQWVDFSVNTFRGMPVIGSFRQSDGVMFIKDGKLHVAMRNIATKTTTDETLSTSDPTKGYRSSTRLVAGNGQELVKENWVTMDPAKLPEPKAGGAAEAPVLTLPNSNAPAPEPTPATPTAPAAAPAPTPAPAPSADAPPSNRSAQERLKELQDLYDKGLITEKEYQTKRKTILDEL
jgi:hypothetical protein